eukprot:Pompholyxophrys_punicea_v1_NODE_210_length_2732_cov_4.604034.p2 type:complete len:275 gc:universal NODE_210_length_2732_cov_4.604034:2435-1611(-)
MSNFQDEELFLQTVFDICVSLDLVCSTCDVVKMIEGPKIGARLTSITRATKMFYRNSFFHCAKIVLVYSSPQEIFFHFEVLGDIQQSGSAIQLDDSGVCEGLHDDFVNCLRELSPSSEKTCCVGISHYEDPEFNSKVTFMSKSVHSEKFGPFGKYAVREGHQPWFRPQPYRIPLHYFRCDDCRDLCQKLNTLMKNAPTEEERISWEDPSSSRHLSKMPLDAILSRYRNLMKISQLQRKKLTKLREAYDVEIAEQQSCELAWLAETVSMNNNPPT